MPLTRLRTAVPAPPKRRFAFKVYDIEEHVEINIIAKAGPDEAREGIKTVLFAIHGRGASFFFSVVCAGLGHCQLKPCLAFTETERNAQEAYEAAEAARGADVSVLVVAPQFVRERGCTCAVSLASLWLI